MNRRQVILGVLISALILGTQSGCYALMGVKHNYTVARNLQVGLTREEALQVISQGGRVEVKEEIGLPESGNWADIIQDDPVLAQLLVSEARNRKKVIKVLVVNRVWGFMGFGIFYFFFDQDDNLVGHRLIHFN